MLRHMAQKTDREGAPWWCLDPRTLVADNVLARVLGVWYYKSHVEGSSCASVLGYMLPDPTPGARLKFQRNGANRAPSNKWPGLEQFSLNTLQLTQLFINHLSNSLFTSPGNGTGQALHHWP